MRFHATVSAEKGFDRRISSLWARHWLTWVCYKWFSPRAIAKVPRSRRRESLAKAFADGFGDFDLLTAASTTPRKIAGMFVKLLVRHPSLGWLADAFFKFLYNPLVAARDRIR